MAEDSFIQRREHGVWAVGRRHAVIDDAAALHPSLLPIESSLLYRLQGTTLNSPDLACDNHKWDEFWQPGASGLIGSRDRENPSNSVLETQLVKNVLAARDTL